MKRLANKSRLKKAKNKAATKHQAKISNRPKKCDDCLEEDCMCASIRRGLKDIRSGKTFLFSCKHDKKDATICFSCCSDECRRWYKIGKKEGSQARKRRETKPRLK